MCSHLSRRCLVVFNLLCLWHPVKLEALPFETVISFGDSITDTGNVYRLTNHSWPLVPPYYRGRFSDGPVWIEKLGVTNLHNYAHGGATSDNDLVQGYSASGTVPVPGARQQIQLYLTTAPQHSRESKRTLHIIWIGSNDYYFNDTLCPSHVASSVLNAAQDLLDHGIKHLLIFNQIPRQLMPSVVTDEQVQHYRERSVNHNHQLASGLAQLKYHRQASSVRIFDAYSLILNIVVNTSSSIPKQKTGCWNITNGQLITQCSDPESHLFIDQYHFTTQIHQFIAEGVRRFFPAHSSANIGSTHCIRLLVFVLFFLLT